MSWDWPAQRRRASWQLPFPPRRWPSWAASSPRDKWDWSDKWENHNCRAEMEKEYRCSVCGMGNWMSRQVCRGCKAKWSDWNDAPRKQTSNAQNREEDRVKMEALQQVVEAMDDNPAIADTKQKIMEEIASLKKKTTDNRSLAQKLAQLEQWAEREGRRITAVEEEIREMKEEVEKRKTYFTGEVAKITSLKEAIAKDTEFKDADLEAELEMDVDVPVLQTKELDLRRQLNKKKDDKGVQLATKRMKEMEKEADGIRDKIESSKRIKTQVGSPRTPEGAGTAHKAAGSGT